MKATSNAVNGDFLVREIRSADDTSMARILRETLLEHGAAKPGTAYYDESTDALSAHFTDPRSIYLVAEVNREVVGGVGIYPTDGLPEGTCELVKMYIDKDFRGFGIGKKLIAQAMDFARAKGYKKIYLESMPELRKAVAVYEHLGFTHLPAPLGNTGHFSCPIWMILEL